MRLSIVLYLHVFLSFFFHIHKNDFTWVILCVPILLMRKQAWRDNLPSDTELVSGRFRVCTLI